MLTEARRHLLEESYAVEILFVTYLIDKDVYDHLKERLYQRMAHVELYWRF